jgi:hypothetical protein
VAQVAAAMALLALAQVAQATLVAVAAVLVTHIILPVQVVLELLFYVTSIKIKVIHGTLRKSCKW